MLISRELLFFFSALGAFNGILLGLYFLFFIRPKQLTTYLLGGLILALSIRIGKSVLYHFNPDLGPIYLQIGLSACALIGPLLLMYLRSSLYPETDQDGWWRWHLGAWLGLLIIGGFFFSFSSHRSLWDYFFIQFIYLQWLVYLSLSGALLWYWWNDQRSVRKGWTKHAIWTLSMYLGIVLVWIAYWFCGFFNYIMGPILFSLILYFQLLLFLLGRGRSNRLLQDPVKYQNRKIATSEAESLISQLERLMQEQQLYQNPNLKLRDLANQLALPTARLSQLLNDNLGKSFTRYVNEYRVKAAKELLQAKSPFSLEAIAENCGYNSKSTFYAAFKKISGTTPAKYRESLSE